MLFVAVTVDVAQEASGAVALVGASRPLELGQDVSFERAKHRKRAARRAGGRLRWAQCEAIEPGRRAFGMASDGRREI